MLGLLYFTLQLYSTYSAKLIYVIVKYTYTVLSYTLLQYYIQLLYYTIPYNTVLLTAIMH